MLHKDAIVQVTHDVPLGEAVFVRKGTAGRVVSMTVLRRTCVVELSDSQGQTFIATIGGRDLVKVLPNERV